MRADEAMAGRGWRNVPNALSAARLVAAGVLPVLVGLHLVGAFTWVLLACLLSDVADGRIARWLGFESEKGAALDSLADVATTAAGALGVMVLQRQFVAEHRAGLLLVLGFYAAEVVGSLWRYGRVSSFHTLLDRAAAVSAGVFVIALFLFGFAGWLYWMTVGLYLGALTEEMVLICWLPEWRRDVGGVHRLLRNGGGRLTVADTGNG